MSFIKQSDAQNFATISSNVKEAIKTLTAEKNRRAMDKARVFSELAVIVDELDKAQTGEEILKALAKMNDNYSSSIQSSISFGLEDCDRDSIIRVFSVFTSLVQAKRVELALKYFGIFRRMFNSLSLAAEAKMDTQLSQMNNMAVGLGSTLKGVVNTTEKRKKEEESEEEDKGYVG